MTSKSQKQVVDPRHIGEILQALIAGHSQKLGKARPAEGRIVGIGRRPQPLPKRQRIVFIAGQAHAASPGLASASDAQKIGSPWA